MNRDRGRGYLRIGRLRPDPKVGRRAPSREFDWRQVKPSRLDRKIRKRIGSK